MNLFAITNLLCGTFCVLLVVFVLLSGKNRIYRLLAWFNFAVSIWGFETFVASISQNELSALKAWRIAHSGGYFIAALFYDLICSLTGNKQKNLQFFAYAQAAVFIVLTVATPWVLFETRIYYHFFYPVATPLYAIGVSFYLLFVLLSFIELLRYLVKAQGYKKIQAQYLFYGFFIGFSGGTSLLLPEFYLDWLYPCGNVGIFIYAAIVTYAVLKNRILENEEHAQLAHRDKLAAIGTLAASINHEIKNPLYIIQGTTDVYLSHLEEGFYQSFAQLAGKSRETLLRVQEQALRASEIMKRFAIFAKHGVKQEVELTSVNLGKTIEELLPLVRHEFEMDKIECIRKIPADLPLFRADQRHTEEIFFNLIVNACQAMKEVGGRLEIIATQKDGAIHIEVSDTGPGIQASRLSRVFEPFYTTKEEGTGLGLYITKQLVERNGGKIRVKSRVGEGSVFTLEFERNGIPKK